MAGAYDLKPWTKVAVPHDDILGGDFDLSSYAANLGQVDDDAPGCPAVYKDPVAFYNATYMTVALDELLRDVANVLGGGAGNRVLQLRTPFGGGKTHTLIALLHMARNRKKLATAGLCDDYPDPGAARVAVLPCLDLDAAGGRQVGEIQVHTLWGELAMRVGGPEGYEIVREADQLRVVPGGNLLRKLLDGRPTLLLLDEVLTYIEASFGVPVSGDTNLGRQTLLFLQYLTEVVRGLPHCAMAYSLQQSVKEAVGDEGLLQTLDGLVSRVDAKKEPVTGDEVLKVVQRRLFQDLGPESTRQAVAKEYGKLLEGFLSQSAQTESETRAARDQGETLQRRILDSYPFHPELLDLMYHRWGSLPSYQRTRGALQFLATTIGALWNKGEGVGPLIGPGDVPLDDNMVRNTFFSQVGEREAMKSVLDSDLLGSSARCKRVDESVSADVPAYQSFRVGTRVTRALALYSFGAKPGEDRGVLRTDLLSAVQVPGVPGDVFDVALQGLTDTLLYIHSSGRRFRFEKRPNLNKLIDDEVRKIEPHEVRDGIKAQFQTFIDSNSGFVIWPETHGHLLDHKARFQVAFLGPEHTLSTPETMENLAFEWTESCGGSKRAYKNAICFALPSAQAVENARLAARKQKAIQSLIDDKARYRFDPEDLDDLKKRKSRSGTDLQAAVRQMYPTLLLPVAAPPEAQDPIRLERFDIQGYQALGSGLLSNIYRVLENWVFKTAVPTKLVSAVHLGAGEVGTPGHWIAGQKLTDGFFGSVQYPKLLTLAGLKHTVAKGVTRGAFGYVMGAAEVDGKLVLDGRDALTIGEDVEADDIDLSAGSFIVSKAQAGALLAEFETVSGGSTGGSGGAGGGSGGGSGGETGGSSGGGGETGGGSGGSGGGGAGGGTGGGQSTDRAVELNFRAKGGQLFSAFTALQVLSEMADEEFTAIVRIRARSSSDIDRNLYEMSVLMPLDEEDIEVFD